MDQDKIWPKVLNIIKDQVSAANFKTWFSQTDLVSLDTKELTIATPSAFNKGQLISRYDRLIKEAVNKVLDRKINIGYTVDSTKFQKELPEDNLFLSLSSPSTTSLTNLNPRYTLENFVVGLTNNLAFAAAQAIVEHPGVSYNPLFIYGPSGVGKTHLMQGIGNYLKKKNPALRLVYIPSERFTVDFVDSIQTKKTADFRRKYRLCDCLLVDDIQFIAGKDSTQEEFFHTYNELHAKNSQIVLTSDRPPHEMFKLESRLLSRFQGGLMVDIQLPDYDTRVAILKSKLAGRGESLPDEYLNLIAERVVSNTRELEGKLIQILQLIKTKNQPVTLEEVTKLLGEKLKATSAALDHKKILSVLNHYFNLKMSDLLGPRRQKELVLPRQIAMYLLYEEGKLSMDKIGQILGGRDHTTILHGVDKIRSALSRDREIQRLVVEVKQSLG